MNIGGGEGDGRGAVLAMAGETFERLTTEAQGDLIGLPHPQTRAEAARKAGRPPGSRNRRQEEIGAWVRENIGDVLMQQAIVAVMPVHQLVAAGLTVKEAMEERRLSAATVLPYLEMRQPLAVDVKHRQMVHLTIVEGDGAGGETVEHQEVIGVLDAPV